MKAKKNRAAVQLGRLGGRAGRGSAKARTSEQARAAASRRWELHRQRTKAREGETAGRTGPSVGGLEPVERPELN